MKDFEKQEISTVNADGNITTWEASKKDGMVRLHNQFENNPKFFKTITYDENSVVIIDFNHGAGSGTIKIPSGEIYDIIEVFNILTKLGVENFSPSRVFKGEMK